jgi:hypothetical protein
MLLRLIDEQPILLLLGVQDNDRDSSHQASQVDEAEGVAQQAHGTDFRRGRRYKKLSRILNSAAAQKIINRFR